MSNVKNMTREDFIELFGFDMSNPDNVEAMESIYDEAYDKCGSWFKVAQGTIASMDAIIRGI